MVGVFFAVAALDLLFAAMLRLAGPLDAEATWAGLGAATTLGLLASGLVVRSRARGGFAFATAVPATVSAAWCIATIFVFRGPMCFIRWAGLSARATDMAWLERLTLLGLACGVLFGIVLAIMMRGRSWMFGALAFVGVASIPMLGLAGAATAAVAQVSLGALAFREARAMRSAQAELRSAHAGGPYRIPETQIDRLRSVARTMQLRAWGASTAMLVATAIAVAVTRA